MKENQVEPPSFEDLLRFLLGIHEQRSLSESERQKAGEKYEEVRRRLLLIIRARLSKRYYEVPSPEEVADATFDRAMSKIPEVAPGYVGDPALYIYRIATFIILEILRRTPPRDDRPLPDPSKAVLLDCLDECLSRLPRRHQELILRFYTGQRGTKIRERRRLAKERGITPNALRIRAHRIRKKLATCVLECVRRSDETI